MDFKLKTSGNFDSTVRWLNSMKSNDLRAALERAGSAGVEALSAGTPTETGLAARSWSYKVKMGKKGFSVAWYNSDVENGFPVVIMLQYGYSTGTGGYVQGRDFINPAIEPIFEQLKADISRMVSRG